MIDGYNDVCIPIITSLLLRALPAMELAHFSLFFFNSSVCFFSFPSAACHTPNVLLEILVGRCSRSSLSPCSLRTLIFDSGLLFSYFALPSFQIQLITVKSDFSPTMAPPVLRMRHSQRSSSSWVVSMSSSVVVPCCAVWIVSVSSTNANPHM